MHGEGGWVTKIKTSALVVASSVAVSVILAPNGMADPSFSPNEIQFLNDIRSIGANPPNAQAAVNFGYNICSDIQSGTPESMLIEGIAGYTDAEMRLQPSQRPAKPTEAQAQQLIYAATRDLCPNAR